ncbi:TetR/AcrR family transcriptional regulator [Cellulomonas oligotrophica]|uniref:AcrR family transcriptional regulator n=1 Tax=Cellulomonas oligotrophica TaxID=931536 RepID=A0A7Y9FIH1_9CELL|nr:TetR/AcrR family transcriptional regulator [Cellulomonas oligotrophica]NYD87885.1 AcrR family transcriptional regulator [Cellulomonas oligotrophica]GIG32908.1 TetR family transcriptional regulator [Cellulomonas oligotrophica]
MGRPPSFDHAQAVTAARDVFWARGYDATSLTDLEDATGLSRSSLYHAFTSKHGLFDAAVEDYLATVVEPLLRPLREDPGAATLPRHFERLARTVGARAADDPRQGCLLLGVAAGLAGRDPHARATVAAYRERVTAAMGAAVGHRWPGLDDDARAHRAALLTGLQVAGLTLARVDPGAAAALLRSAARQVGDWDA